MELAWKCSPAPAPFTDITLQLRYPWEMYNLSALLAQAFYTVPEAKSLPTLTNIQEGLSESYSHFDDGLAQALQTQGDLDEENKQLMLKPLAFENANIKTKSLLTTLCQGAEAGEMLELAQRATNPLRAELSRKLLLR
ncbi:hypothetical protein TURU_001370 [Turdus rufiventris]|nr:hypothetical protein TURU_001370 [Turdus rufiventris]